MKTLLVLMLLGAAVAERTPHNQSPVLTDLINDENLLQQFRQWQQSFQQQNQEQDSVLSKNYGGGNNYPSNPWLQPQPQPQPQPIGPISRPPPYVEPQPSNPWYQPPVQPQPDPYPQPAPQPIPQPLPYPPQTAPPPQIYPPVTASPPQVYPPAATNPPPAPEVEALRRYCLQPRGQFPTRSCNRYVNCWDETVIEQECPAGLVFSEKGYCDYQFNVDCTGRTLSSGGVSPQPIMPEGQKHCPTLFGNYRSNNNCSEFFVCVHGSPIKFCCPSGLYYSTELGVCDYQYNVDCINPRPLYPEPQPQPQPYPYPQPQPQPLPVPTTEFPAPWNPYLKRIPADLVNEKKSCIPNSVYRLEPDCSSVALCREGRTEVITCGQHTGYNADQGLCVAKHLAKC